MEGGGQACDERSGKIFQQPGQRIKCRLISVHIRGKESTSMAEKSV